MNQTHESRSLFSGSLGRVNSGVNLLGELSANQEGNEPNGSVRALERPSAEREKASSPDGLHVIEERSSSSYEHTENDPHLEKEKKEGGRSVKGERDGRRMSSSSFGDGADLDQHSRECGCARERQVLQRWWWFGIGWVVE